MTNDYLSTTYLLFLPNARCAWIIHFLEFAWFLCSCFIPFNILPVREPLTDFRTEDAWSYVKSISYQKYLLTHFTSSSSWSNPNSDWVRRISHTSTSVTFFKIAQICSKKVSMKWFQRCALPCLLNVFTEIQHNNKCYIQYVLHRTLPLETLQVVCPNGCASAYGLKQAFAQCKIFLEGTLLTYRSKQNKHCFTNNASDCSARFESFVRFSNVPTVYSSKYCSSTTRAWIVVHCSFCYR